MTASNAEVRAVPCPICGAETGRPCQGARGADRQGHHSDRVRAAQEHARAAAAAARRPSSSTPAPPPRPCGCPPTLRDEQGHPLLCPHERERGLAAIARIRAEMKTRHDPAQKELAL